MQTHKFCIINECDDINRYRLISATEIANS